MFTFLFFVGLLVVGYFVYGKIAEKVFVIRPEAKTPAYKLENGVDYVPMARWKCVLLQLINIAGTGPIFGAIAGALFGPAAFAWIVFGCIFAGAVHDYTISMLSMRNDGSHVGPLVGKYLGKAARNIMVVFSLILLLFVGVVFTTTPAMVLRGFFAPESLHFANIAIALIILYYVIATVIPIHKLIGRVYPILGAVMIFMGVAMFIGLFVSGDIRNVPEWSFTNFRPDRDVNILARIFPFLFITIACGAISGFHATQAPIVGRTVQNEGHARPVFYGSMILEGVIAMIWAAVTMGHFNVVGVERAVAAPMIVSQSAVAYLGMFGGALAIIGVALFPITSGDTAFRSARLLIAETFKLDQGPIKNRFLVALPLFAVGVILVLFSQANPANFMIIWRYFAWSNQTLATICLWTVSAYLAKTGKVYWLTLIPATFMTSVVTSYFFTATETLGPIITTMTGDPEVTWVLGIIIGVVLAIVLFVLFVTQIGIKQKGTLQE